MLASSPSVGIAHVTLTNDRQLQALKRAGQLVARTLEAMQRHAEPGMTTLELDQYGERLLTTAGAISAPRKTYDFPGATCISINEEAAHGIPGARKLAAGDMVNIDVSAELDGYYADTGGSFVIPPSNALKEKLCEATLRARAEGIKAARAGEPINKVSRAIQRAAQMRGFKVVRNLSSHGVGAALHEEPTIRNYFDPRDTECLHEGQVITIEPFLSTTSAHVVELDDGWTLAGKPGSLFAQYEHTIVITRNAPIVVTLAS
jgi:methionyl aminopeptidase